MVCFGLDLALGAPPFPSVADALYLAGYPCLLAALVLLVRARGGGPDDLAGPIDAAIVAVGAGILAWVFWLDPYAHDPNLPLPVPLVSLAYPLMDLAVLALGVRLALADSVGRRRDHVLLAGLGGLLASDVLYGLGQLNGTYRSGGLVNLGWLIFYAAVGAATLHPALPAPGTLARSRAVPAWPRLALFVVMALLGPAVLGVRAALG